MILHIGASIKSGNSHGVAGLKNPDRILEELADMGIEAVAEPVCSIKFDSAKVIKGGYIFSPLKDKRL